MNIGFGSFSFSSSLPAGAWAPSGASANRKSAEQARVRYTIEILDTGIGAGGAGSWAGGTGNPSILLRPAARQRLPTDYDGSHNAVCFEEHQNAERPWYTPRVHPNDCGRGRRLHHPAPSRPRWPEVRRPERQGERRPHRRRRPGPDQRPGAVPGRRLPDHRLGRPGRGVGSGTLVLQGQVGPRPGQGGGREALRGQDAEPQVCGLRGLPGDAREGTGGRRRPDRHPRPPARLRRPGGDAGRQARLLREAAHPQHP